MRLSLWKNSGVSPEGFLGRDRSPSGPAPQTLALSKTSPYLGGVWVSLRLRKNSGVSPKGFLGRDRSPSGPVLWRACSAVVHARRHGAFGEIAPPRRCLGEAEFVKGPWGVARRLPR